MLRIFLIHKLADIYLVVETTGVGAKPRPLPTVQFLSWSEVENFFLEIGATRDALAVAKKNIDESGHTQLLVTASA